MLKPKFSRTKYKGSFKNVMPANISSLKLMILEALLTPPIVRWNNLSNTSGWP